jgi:hypothetical protein
MNEETDSSKGSRFLVKVICAVVTVLFVYRFVLPYTLDVLGAGIGLKSNHFLQPSVWDANMVDPSNSNFTTVILSGSYESRTAQYTAARSGNFEIVMRGRDLYFKREWKTFIGGWNWTIELGVTNYYGLLGIRWRGNGSGGGGTHGFGAAEKLLPGRRLWGSTNFLGASNDFLKLTNGTYYSNFRKETEEFSDLKKFGPYLIPQRIVFVSWDESQFTYRVKKVQFRNDPTASWFVEIRDKRFHYSPQEEQKFMSDTSDSKTNSSK